MCEPGEVLGDLWAGPVLGADEFAAEHAIAVDDVGFGDLDGAVELVDALVGIAHGGDGDVVGNEKFAVNVLRPGRWRWRRRQVQACAAAGPGGRASSSTQGAHQVAHRLRNDNVAAETWRGQRSRVPSVMWNWGARLADVSGVRAAVAGGEGEKGGEEEGRA